MKGKRDVVTKQLNNVMMANTPQSADAKLKHTYEDYQLQYCPKTF